MLTIVSYNEQAYCCANRMEVFQQRIEEENYLGSSILPGIASW